MRAPDRAERSVLEESPQAGSSPNTAKRPRSIAPPKQLSSQRKRKRARASPKTIAR
jgi:hypothetical protein